ncbi:hypothetical protein AGMMS49942_00230 [Spirochaetia bacterium]|nr:hypothetical protein AGMMS49942_00230 [Spirochaetia bacterium]
MIIEQTVEIPANRRVTFDLPYTFPIGKAKVALVVYPEENRAPAEISEATPLTDRLSGILSHADDISPDELRAERLSKYLK